MCVLLLLACIRWSWKLLPHLLHLLQVRWDLRWDSANVSGTVTSQASGFTRDHGMSVAPSGRFPSVRDSPTGSLATGICARLMALHITSLSLACRCRLALLRLHDNPWSPLASTSLPHGQVCGSHVRSPSRYPTATRTISSLSLRPTDVIDGARSQSPACSNDAARMRALPTSVVSWVHISIYYYYYYYYFILFYLFLL